MKKTTSPKSPVIRKPRQKRPIDQLIQDGQVLMEAAQEPGGMLNGPSSLGHRPADPARFDFDEQVAVIFRDMALRSIPNYELAHQIHSDLLVQHLKRYQYQNNSILDIGSSLGDFFTYLDQAITAQGQDNLVTYRGFGLDKSAPMNRKAEQAHPKVNFDVMDLAEEGKLEYFAGTGEEYLAINCMYTLQFLKPERQTVVLKLLADMLVPKVGILILGTKLDVADGREITQGMHDAYMSFRLRNGYKIEEIVAKSQALVNSMYAPTEDHLDWQTGQWGLYRLVETTRAMVFSTRIYQSTRQ